MWAWGVGWRWSIFGNVYVCVVLFLKHSENICIPLNPACVALIISCMHQGFLSQRSHSSSHITHDWRGGSHCSRVPLHSFNREETIKGSMRKGKNWYTSLDVDGSWFSTIYRLKAEYTGMMSLYWVTWPIFIFWKKQTFKVNKTIPTNVSFVLRINWGNFPITFHKFK